MNFNARRDLEAMVRTVDGVLEKPEDGDLVDCPPECAGAVACYAAAQLAALDDASLQAALYNEFENRLSRLGELPVANREEIGNMYGGWEAVE